jgi:hypothetical protein
MRKPFKNGDYIQIVSGPYPVGEKCRYIDVSRNETDLYNPNGTNKHWWIMQMHAKKIDEQMMIPFGKEHI